MTKLRKGEIKFVTYRGNYHPFVRFFLPQNMPPCVLV